MNDTPTDEIIQSGIQAGESGQLTPAAEITQAVHSGRRRPLARSAIVAALLLLGLIAGSISVVSAADGSLPGSRLYPVKTAFEDIRLALAARQETKIKLCLHFAQQRVAEIEALIENAKPEYIQIAVGRYEQHVKQATLTLTQIPAQDRQHLAELAELVTNVISCECRSLAEILPQIAAAYQPSIDSAVAVSRSNYVILTTVFAASLAPTGLEAEYVGPTVIPAGSDPQSTPPTATRQATATVKPTARSGGSAPTAPAARSTSTPAAAPSSSPISIPLTSPSATSTRVPVSSGTPTSTMTPVATTIPVRETRTATTTPAVLPTNTPVPTSTSTVMPTATKTPVPSPTATLPPGLTKTVEPPRLTKTPPPGPTRTPGNH